MKKYFLILASLSLTNEILAQSLQITTVDNRVSTSLNGEWKYLIDPYENGFYNYRLQPFDEMDNPPKSAYFTDSKPADKTELLEYDWDTSPSISVPGDWNHQFENLEWYEGTIWYRKKFSYQKSEASNRVFIHFGAINYHSKIYLNGEKVGEHTGGFTPFQFEVTDLIQDENSIVVFVNNNRKPEGVPTVNTDWYNYGGITRDVMLIETPQQYVSDYMIQLNPENPNEIKGYIHTDGFNRDLTATISIPELSVSESFTLEERVGAFNFTVNNIEYWSPKTLSFMK